MGAGVSREEATAYLDRQEQLIGKLSAAIAAKKAAAAGATAAAAATNQDIPAWLAVAANRFDAVSSGREYNVPESLMDEFIGLTERSRAAERRRNEPEVEDYELKLPANEWVDPTPEQAKKIHEARPWLSVISKPEGFQYGQTDAKPYLKLELEHVYGYRSSGVRNNLRWVSGSAGQQQRILFSAAGVAVVHDVTSHKQTFFREHQDEITALTVSKDGVLVATADQGKYPSIYVWDVESKTVRAKLTGELRRAVVSLAFSDCGTYVAAVGLDDEHSISIYDWKRGKPVSGGPGSTQHRILQVIANREESTKEAFPFITLGEHHARWWSFDKKSSSSRAPLTSQPLALGAYGDIQTYTVAFSTPEMTVIGTANGELYLTTDCKLRRVVDAHHGPVTSLSSTTNASIIVSGGYDGYISQWHVASGFRRLNSITISAKASGDNLNVPLTFSRPNSIRALDVLTNPMTGAVDNVLVGCVSGNIHSVRGTEVHDILHAHGGDLSTANVVGELTGLASHPTQPRFVSVGETTVFLWDTTQRQAIKKIRLPTRGQCVSWSPTGQHILIGMHNGVFLIFNENLEVVKEVKASNRRVQCARFSVDGTVLAVGTADNMIQLYDASSRNFDLGGKLEGALGVPLTIDFSADGKYLQCSTQDYEVVYYDVHQMKALPEAEGKRLSHMPWVTFSSLLGWDVQGIWPQDSQLNDVSSVCRSSSGKLLATAEETGLIKVFRFPCVGGGLDYDAVLHRRPDSVRVLGHGGKVSQVAWLLQDTMLISAGGEDLSCFQWRVVPTTLNGVVA